MKIGINLLFLIPNKVGGTETYSRGIIDALYKFDKINKYVLFCNNENYKTFDKKYKKVLIPINASNRFVRLLAEQILLPFYSRANKIDVLYSLGYTSPLFNFTNSIVNIFDLNWYYHPEDFNFLQRIVWKFFVTNSARFSDSITTSSFSSRDSIHKILNKYKRIDVVYPGIPKMTKAGTLATTKIKGRYFFSVSAAYPHKNLLGLLKSYKKFLDIGGEDKLIIVGLGGKSTPEVKEYINRNNLDGKVRLLGYVTDRELNELYKNSIALIVTSKYEGFGMPVIEAFGVGLPVVSSDAFSLKEVVGKNGLLFKPDDNSGFAKGMLRISKDKKYRDNLKNISKSGSYRFVWKDSAKKLSDVFNNINEHKN